MDTTADDWWDRLYADEDQAPAEPPEPRRIAVSSDRLPDWWTAKPIHLGEQVNEEESEEDTGADVVDDEPDEADDEEEQGEDQEDDDEDVSAAPYPKAPAAESFWRGWAPAGSVGMQLLHPVRGRKVLYNASAAALGWGLGAAQPLEDLISTCGREYGRTGALVLGAAVVIAIGVLIDHKTRHWWPPLAWMCRIPLATASLALLLAQF
ncbi:hypothetical protein [Streptomyces violens]|uniref:hypothetical protein n=1 Tax=Streptomyces violens TaxID=66377 RepID=UPI0004C19DE9|nr:hypothetical protein [Streptomyces violens]